MTHGRMGLSLCWCGLLVMMWLMGLTLRRDCDVKLVGRMMGMVFQKQDPLGIFIKLLSCHV